MVTRVPAEVYRVGVEALTWELSFVPTKKKKKKKKRPGNESNDAYAHAHAQNTRARSVLPSEAWELGLIVRPVEDDIASNMTWNAWICLNSMLISEWQCMVCEPVQPRTPSAERRENPLF